MPHFLVYGPDKANSQRAKHAPAHHKYVATLDPNITKFVGLSMSANNLTIANDLGVPVEITGTALIYEAASFDEAQKIVHADPFWSSGEVWDHDKVVITFSSVVHNTLPAKTVDFQKLARDVKD